jgi:hypothetical protein
MGGLNFSYGLKPSGDFFSATAGASAGVSSKVVESKLYSEPNGSGSVVCAFKPKLMKAREIKRNFFILEVDVRLYGFKSQIEYQIFNGGQI